MKFIGKTSDEMCKYALDYHSISHFIAGIFGYIIGFVFFNIFFAQLTSCLLTYLTVLVGSLIWELVENAVFVYLKPNEQQDNVLNSICDTSLVFLGGVAGIFVYNLSLIIAMIVIGAMFLFYTICWILTMKKFWRH